MGSRSSVRCSHFAGGAKKKESYSAFALSLFSFASIWVPSARVTLRVGMQVLDPSPDGAEMKRWMVHMDRSSAFSSQAIQCSFFASRIICVYLFHSLRCSSRVGCLKMWRLASWYTLRASLRTCLRFSFSSVDHHRFM